MRFLSPVHLGAPGSNVETSSHHLPADSLFGALCNAWLRLYGESALTQELLADGCPLRLTSAFPFAGEGEEGLFLPRPMLIHTPNAEDAENVREWRQCFLVSVPLWLQAARQQVPSRSAIEEDRARLRRCLGVEARPRVALDRATSGSALYFCALTHFAKGCGLWFLVDAPDDLLPRLEGAIRLLGEEGVGGERSSGCGRFRPDFAECPTLAVQSGSSYCTLSPFHPAPPYETLPAKALAYSLIQRKGWVASSDAPQARKKATWMFAEGSVFAEPLPGHLVDVTPRDDYPHRVFRYAHPWWVPIQGGDQ